MLRQVLVKSALHSEFLGQAAACRRQVCNFFGVATITLLNGCTTN